MLFKDWDIELTGERVRITPMRMEDDPSYGKMLLGPVYEQSVAVLGKADTGIEKIIDHTEQDETHALRLVGDDALIGWITLQKDTEGRPDIGISLVKEHQNHGIGPEAVTLFANRLHSVYGLDCVHVRISVLNPQCQKAFLKIGAVLDKAEPDYRLKKILDAFPEDARPDDPPPDMLFYHIDLPISGTPFTSKMATEPTGTSGQANQKSGR